MEDTSKLKSSTQGFRRIPLNSNRIQQDLDGGWAWMVLISTCLSCINISCLTYNVGIINIALLEKYQKDVAATSFVGSTYLSLYFLTSPLASILINKLSCRATHILGGIFASIGFSFSYFAGHLEVLVFTYSLLGAAGLSLCNTVTNIVISFYFRKYLGLSIALSMTGCGFGMFVSGPFSQFLIDMFDIEGTFLILGGLCLNQVVFGCIMRPNISETAHKLERFQRKWDENKRDRLCETSQLQILSNKSFVIILICSFMWSVPNSVVILHLPYLVVLNGYTTEDAALLITIFGVGSTLSRFITGLSLGPTGLDPLLLFVGFNGILGCLTLAFNLYSHVFYGIASFAFLFGVYTGGLNAVKNPLCINIVGMKYLSTGIGLILFLEGTGYIVGAPTAGFIVDITQSYDYSFLISGIFFIVSFFLSLHASLWRKDLKDSTDLHNEEARSSQDTTESTHLRISSTQAIADNNSLNDISTSVENSSQ